MGTFSFERPRKTAEAEAKRSPDHQSGCQSCGSEQRKNRVQRPPRAGVGTSSGSDDTKSTESVREVIGEKRPKSRWSRPLSGRIDHPFIKKGRCRAHPREEARRG